MQAALDPLALAALILPFAVILAGDPPRECGLHADDGLWAWHGALALVGLQFALTGRLKPLLRPFGADIIPVCSPVPQLGAVALMLGHFAMMYIWHKDDMAS